MTRKSLGTTLGILLCLASPALADSITITSSSIASTTLNPSSDSISLDAGSAILSGPGSVVFQTGNIYAGDSEIPDQLVSFFLYDTITINGVSQVLTILGQDNVTTNADLITLSANPLQFGDLLFTLDSSTYTIDAIGQNIPVNLSGTVTAAPTPEPGTLSLLATGVIGSASFVLRRRKQLLGL